MNRFTLLLLVPLLALKTWADEARIDADVVRRFRTEYPGASKRLRDFYQNLEMTGRSTEKGVILDLVYYGGNGSQCSITSKFETGSSVARVATPSSTFRVRRASRDRPFYLEAMGPASGDEYRKFVEIIHLDVPLAAAPYCLLERGISDFCLEKSFSVSGANRFASEAGECVMIEWVSPIGPDAPRRGSFVFLAEASWALREYEVEFYGPSWGSTGKVWHGQHGIIDYEGQQDGVALIKRLTAQNHGPAGKAPAVISEVSSIKVGPVSRDHFTPAYFGIRTDPAPKAVPLMYYLFALAAAFAALAVVLRWLSNRRGRGVATI